MTRRLATCALAWLVLSALVGCAADKPKPSALESFTPRMAARQVWTAKLDSVQFSLAVAVRDSSFIVAGTDGEHTMSTWQLILGGWACMVVVMAALWAIQRVRGDAGIVDGAESA